MTRLSKSISRARKSRSKPSVMSLTMVMPIRQPMDEVVLVLPAPPSKNDLRSPTGRGGGMRRTAAYRAWIETAGRLIMANRTGRVEGRYRILIEVPRSVRGDTANREEATSDLLQAMGVVSNDGLAEDVRSIRGDGPEFRVTVTRLGT